MKNKMLCVFAGLLSGLLPAAAGADIWFSGSPSTGEYQLEILVGGSPLPASYLSGQAYVEGRIGERYVLRIHNRSWRRVEAVISVDGRDAIDGRDAQLGKRGYVIPAYSFIDVDGFRLNRADVAAFRFTTVPDSYTARMGTPWKVGVVGVAFFPEFVRPRPRPRPPLAMEGRGRPGTWDEAAEAPAAGAAKSSRPYDGDDAYPGSRRNLGTEFGERRYSPVSETSFNRENWGSPAARLSLRYDDRRGLCNLGLGAFCYPTYPPPYDPPYYPPYYPPPPRPDYSNPPPGWEHFNPGY
jgi:hypothetical protein